jgi:hypothetical protein
VLSTAVAVLFVVRQVYFWAALFTVAGIGLAMRAWEERHPPDG